MNVYLSPFVRGDYRSSIRKNLLKPEGRIFVKPRLSARELATETRRPGLISKKSLGLKGRFLLTSISHNTLMRYQWDNRFLIFSHTLSLAQRIVNLLSMIGLNYVSMVISKLFAKIMNVLCFKLEGFPITFIYW